MCLGIPGRLVSRFDLHGQPMGRVDFGGITKTICLAYVPEIAVGEYTVVHVGFAIAVVDERSALESLELFRPLGMLEDELGPEPVG
jgi:hydrogenase expression/formation protein HypC